MSRKNKFRVWSEEDREYRTDCRLTELFTSETGIPATVYSNEGDRFDIEQYTGLKDKNGKEICEGDIFRNAINGGTWRVYWNEKDAAFWVDSGVAGCSLGEFDWDRSNRKYGFIRKNCEIIGNIHENPELLGGGE